MADQPPFPEREHYGCTTCGSTNHTTGDTNWCPVERERATDPPFISDVFAAAVPEKFDLSDPEQFPVIHDLMNQLAKALTLDQYRRPPKALLFEPTEWLVTSDPADIERFQPAHDCEECRAGNERALTFLRDNPGRAVALGNLSYREVW